MAGRFSQQQIDRVRDASDIVDVVGRYVTLRPAGKDFKGLCPFHEEKTPSFSVSPSRQIFKCFGCGVGGAVFQFIMLREKLSFPETVELLARRAGIPLQTVEPTGAQGSNRNELATANAWTRDYFRQQYLHPQQGRVARDYFQGRELTEETAEQFGLGYAGSSGADLIRQAGARGIGVKCLTEAGIISPEQHGSGYYPRFRNRLMFPIEDTLDRVIGFGGRTLGDDRAKYLNSPQTPLFDKGRNLYGLNRAKDAIAREKTAVVVEGYTDCLMAHQQGVENVVATLGTALTEQQVKILGRFAERVILVFDADDAGIAAADRAMDLFIRQGVNLRLCTVPEGKDPCDYLLKAGADAFRRLLDAAKDVLDFKWELTQSALAAAESTPAAEKAVNNMLTTLVGSEAYAQSDPIRRGFVANHLSRLLGITPQDVQQRIGQLGRSLRRRQNRPVPAAPAETARLEIPDRAEEEILEVILSDPSYLQSVEGVIEPGQFGTALQASACRVWQWAKGTEPVLADLVAGCEDASDAGYLTELANRAAGRNPGAQLEGAIRRWRSRRAKRYVSHLAQRISDGTAPVSDEEEVRLLREYQQRKQMETQRSPSPLSAGVE